MPAPPHEPTRAQTVPARSVAPPATHQAAPPAPPAPPPRIRPGILRSPYALMRRYLAVRQRRRRALTGAP